MTRIFVKASFVLSIALMVTASVSAQHKLVKKWQTDTVFKSPESVLYDGGNNVLYVSNINGDASAKDGNGYISKLGPDGKVVQLEWVTGLNAPKGLGQYNNILYAADVDEVVAIDIQSGKITQRIPVEGAGFLNDITVSSKGIVYVSDTKTGKVHRIENGTVTTFADGIKGANGVLAVGDYVYALGAGSLYKLENGKKPVVLAKGMEGSTDGIEHVAGNDYVVSCWNGVIYYVNTDGTKQEMLNTTAQKINSADIGYDAKSRTVFVPTFLKNSVAAYELK